MLTIGLSVAILTHEMDLTRVMSESILRSETFSDQMPPESGTQ